ncbi:MAG: carbohydrate porin [Bdellovibrionales bacterium]|nr:carbohydrate porin [Bdellovibrionales bacterium]
MKSNSRILAFLVAAFFTMAFTIPGCPDMDSLNQRLDALEKQANANKKQTQEIADQLRILNDEHNTMKTLVSQVSQTVLEQKDALEKVNAAMAARRAPPPAPAPSKSKSKRHR